MVLFHARGLLFDGSPWPVIGMGLDPPNDVGTFIALPAPVRPSQVSSASHFDKPAITPAFDVEVAVEVTPLGHANDGPVAESRADGRGWFLLAWHLQLAPWCGIMVYI